MIGIDIYLMYLTISINSYLIITDASGRYERLSFIVMVLCAVQLGGDIRSAIIKTRKKDIELQESKDTEVKNTEHT
jgi:hypothetical protein